MPRHIFHIPLARAEQHECLEVCLDNGKLIACGWLLHCVCEIRLTCLESAIRCHDIQFAKSEMFQLMST
jgi:hypothetical protein